MQYTGEKEENDLVGFVQYTGERRGNGMMLLQRRKRERGNDEEVTQTEDKGTERKRGEQATCAMEEEMPWRGDGQCIAHRRKSKMTW